eukprot:scaffold13.g244.t1
MGVGAASDDHHTTMLSGVSGMVAGALSMAVGEYISVSSQRDAEAADIEQERLEQLKGPEIYEERGLTYQLAREVAQSLTEKDVVRAHARDELVRMAIVILATTLGLVAFGALAAWLGGANKLRAGARVVLGGWAAMGATYAIGMAFEK